MKHLAASPPGSLRSVLRTSWKPATLRSS